MTVHLLKHLRQSLPEIECPSRRKRRRKIRNKVKRIRTIRKIRESVIYHPVLISLMVIMYRMYQNSIGMIHEFKDPVPVVTDLGSGYVWYVRDGGIWENDIFTVVLEEGGKVKHFRSDQIKVHKNATFDISNNN